jgi:hypothetical protein
MNPMKKYDPNTGRLIGEPTPKASSAKPSNEAALKKWAAFDASSRARGSAPRTKAFKPDAALVAEAARLAKSQEFAKAAAVCMKISAAAEAAGDDKQAEEWNTYAATNRDHARSTR